jgi:hypothetical protein
MEGCVTFAALFWLNFLLNFKIKSIYQYFFAKFAFLSVLALKRHILKGNRNEIIYINGQEICRVFKFQPL